MTQQERRERAEAMYQLYQSGVPVKEIAQQFGVSATTVYVALHRAGLPTAGAGRGWHGNSQGHARAGRKGGKTANQDRERMAEIGRKGGQTTAANREFMAQIGRKGGSTPKRKKARQEADRPEKGA